MGKIVDRFVSSELDKCLGDRRLCVGCSLWAKERRKTVRAKAPCKGAMDAISLAEEHGLLYPYDSVARQQMLDHAQWLRAKLHQ